MATVTKFADANAAVVTGWTNPTNAYADEGTYATAAPAKNATVSSDYGFPAFTTGDIPDGATINSCTVEVQWKWSTTSSIATAGVQQHNPAGTALGSETISATPEPTVDTVQTQQVTSGIALADLRSANVVVARVRATRGNSNTACTASLDYVKLTVDYTVSSTYDESLTASATASDGEANALTAAGSVTGSATGSAEMSSVETAVGSVTGSSSATTDLLSTLQAIASLSADGAASTSQSGGLTFSDGVTGAATADAGEGASVGAAGSASGTATAGDERGLSAILAGLLTGTAVASGDAAGDVEEGDPPPPPSPAPEPARPVVVSGGGFGDGYGGTAWAGATAGWDATEGIGDWNPETLLPEERVERGVGPRVARKRLAVWKDNAGAELEIEYEKATGPWPYMAVGAMLGMLLGELT